MIRPIPLQHGIGFVSNAPVELDGYRYEQVGRYHNYYVTAQRWQWPEASKTTSKQVIDGFSPNLNKQLHVGHLRNLALARAIAGIQEENVKMVAMLGASLGVRKAALDGWKYWTNFVNYHPKVYYDIALPDDVVAMREATADDGIDLGNGVPMLWDGPKGPVIVKRADGRAVYACHDLAFAQEVTPTHYITGHEQKEHFQMLGMGEKHLPMGLVLGADGKKLKSRDGTALLAIDAVTLVKENLKEAENLDQLAWNILCWNFLHVNRHQDVKFEVEKWCHPDSPGMYISYTYARIETALGKAMKGGLSLTYNHSKAAPCDYQLLGMGEQLKYYHNRSVEKLDPSSLANALHDVCRYMGELYHKERIVGGRTEFLYALNYVNGLVEETMDKLGMFPLLKV